MKGAVSSGKSLSISLCRALPRSFGKYSAEPELPVFSMLSEV